MSEKEKQGELEERVESPFEENPEAAPAPPEDPLTLTPTRERTPFDDASGSTAPNVKPPRKKPPSVKAYKLPRTPFDDAAESIAATERANEAEDAAAAESGEPPQKDKAKPPISTNVRILAGIGVLLMIALTLLYTYSIATGAFLKW